MRLLLDTHAFLWWVTNHRHCTARMKQHISDPDNEVYFSAASAWEIAIKAKLGKLQVPLDLKRFMQQQLLLNNFTLLPIDLQHALHVYTLPSHHRDPFDRILIAQSQTERLVLVTKDPKIARYAVKTLW